MIIHKLLLQTLYVIDDQIYMQCLTPQGYVNRIMPHLLSREDLSTLYFPKCIQS